MTISDLKRRVEDAIQVRYPQFPVRIGCIGEDSTHWGISVFGVPKPLVRSIEDLILDLDPLASQSDIVLTPMVRDLETTKRYYPEHVRGWESVAIWAGIAAGISGEVWDVSTDTGDLSSALWRILSNEETPHVVFKPANEGVNLGMIECAANEELALAA